MPRWKKSPLRASAPQTPRRATLKVSLRMLFVIRRRDDIRSRSGVVVGPFPHRNGILAPFSFGIDIWHDYRALKGFPVFPR